MTEPTEDFYIAMAVLHGAEITNDEGHWYVNEIDADDPVACKNQRQVGHFWFRSKAEAARAYCEYHKLI